MADAHTKQHDYHLVDPSPWPFVGSVSAFVLAVGAIAWMRTGTGELATGLSFLDVLFEGPYLFFAGLIGVLYTMYGWWSDVINESVHQGEHTPVVKLHLRYGMLLFIASEVMFFVAWFWAYFDAALFPDYVQKLKVRILLPGLLSGMKRLVAFGLQKMFKHLTLGNCRFLTH